MYGQSTYSHVSILEVLHGVLHPEAHNNGLKKKSVARALQGDC